MPLLLLDMQLSALKFTVTRPVQPEKAEAPQSVTEGGMVIVINPVQRAKAELPMLFTLFGSLW